MANQRTYLILGSGIAAMAAAEAVRTKDPAARVRMISAEKDLCFNRPMLIREFALDGSGAELFEKQQDWPDRFDVDVRLGVRAESIDREGKRVLLSDGTIEPYDRLIYALGAEAAIPPIPGAERDHVHVVRTREDMGRIREAMRTARTAAVIGGGMLGMEDAWALRQEKIQTAIVEQRQRVAFAQIDQSAGNLMKKRIERMGVPVYVNAAVTEIGDGYVTFLQDGEPVTISADLVILSAGVTPNSALGKDAGLAAAGSCWIAVDEQCRTSDPDIFAAGDCAAVNGRNDAIWDEAREMGRVAGSNAASAGEGTGASGQPAVYEPVVAEHVFTGFDTEVFTMADSSGAGTDGVYIRHADVEIFDYQRERYIRVSLHEGKIAGILLINAPELAPELMRAFHDGEGEEEARRIILRWRESHDVDFKPAAQFRRR